MLHINSVSEDSMKTLAKLYHLPLSGPSEIYHPSKLAEYVFERCFHLIPRRLMEFFKVNSLFKSELILHMIINAHIVQLTELEGYVELKGALFARIFDFYNIAVANDKSVYNLFGIKNVPRLSKDHLSKLCTHWMFPSLDNASGAIPAFLVPLIAFQTIHFDSHKVLKDSSDSHHSWTYMKNNKDMSKMLHLHFYDNFKYLLDHFPTIDKIERTFSNNQLSYHSTLNRILFEREYNLGLASKIVMMIMNYPEEVQKSYYPLLGIAAMLPNINGRLFYLTSMFTGNISEFINQLTPQDDFIIQESITLNEKLVRIEKISRDLIGMALFTIPVMEVYFLYLWQKGNCTFDDSKMKKLMTNYEVNFFIDDRIQPPTVSIDDKTIQTMSAFGFRLNGEWELADLPFTKIRDILKILNGVTEIQRDFLSNIHLTPHQFLEVNGFDEKSLLLLDEYSIQELIDSVTDVVDEKYLQVLFNDLK